MTTPVLRIANDTVVVRPEGLPLPAEISQLAAAAGGAAAVAQISAISEYGDSYNLFDKDAVVVGGEVQFNGGQWGTGDGDTGSVVSAPIDISRLAPGTQLTISGLAPNLASPRVWAFYSGKPTAINAPEPLLISYVLIPSAEPFTTSIPAGAKWTKVTPRQRQPGGGSYALVQIERGSEATAFRPYAERLIRLDGREVGPLPQAAGAEPSDSIGPLFMFGDSITRQKNVNAGDYTGTNVRQNWPDYALPIINPSIAYNFAIESASFATRSDTTSEFEKFQHQIDVALAQGVTPACVIVALGINDFRFLSGNLGTYNTAMGKAVNALDLTVPIESARKGFYRLQQAWPNAVKFVSLPLQNGQSDLVALKAWTAVIAQMANRYGFQVIDAFSESGIVADFENTSTAGQDLEDGLHPHASGQRKQGRLIGARVRARLVA